MNLRNTCVEVGDSRSVSMLCDLDMVVVFGKYRCVVIMEADNSNQPCVYLQKLQKAGYGIDDLVTQA